MIKKLFKSRNNQNLPQVKQIWVAGLFLFLISLTLSISPLIQTPQLKLTNIRWNHWIGFVVWVIMFSLISYKYKEELINKDIILMPIVALLSGWGLITVWRLAPSLGLKQTFWLILSIGSMIICFPYREKILSELRKHKYVWLVIGLIITALTFIFGTNPTGYGPKLWLGCCGLFVQPAEPLKLLLILYLAAYFADRQPFISQLAPLITPTVFITGITLLILIFQRDLGTASIFIFIYSSMIYSATGKKRLLLISLLVIAIGAVIGYYLFDVVQLRIEAWVNPWQDPSGRSFQIVQSLISIAAGGLTGRGPGMGSPTLVPISFSDFIFSAIAEEYGFPGTLGLIIILSLFTYRGFSIALRAPDNYQRYLSTGLTVYIASQAILIIGGNIRLLPLTGVTLPFFSYGGSSLLSTFLAVFLIISINQKTTDNVTITKDPLPIIHLAAIIFFGYLSITFINAWWSIYRGPNLVNRTDNPRRSISDQFNKRGDILDRNYVPLSYSEGNRGNYERIYTFPELSPIIGYTHDFYGQAGIESSLDPVLRGLENQSPWNLWYYHLLYGQSPPGLDVQLSIDSNLQHLASSFFSNTPGAVVLIDSEKGEILVLFSSPIFDANTLDESWEILQTDINSPFINRATQSLYPPGPSLAPFIIAQTESEGPLSLQITNLESIVDANVFTCTSGISLPANWGIVGRNGCPGPLEYLGANIGASGLEELFSKLGFYQAPDIGVNISPPYIPAGILNPSITGFGQSDILVTPLQMAFAASTLSNNGKMPSPILLLSTQNSDGDWIKHPSSEGEMQVFSPFIANQTARSLANPSLPIWETTAYAKTTNGTDLTWYLAGSLPGEGTPYSVVILLESKNAELAKLIGQRLLNGLLTSQN